MASDTKPVLIFKGIEHSLTALFAATSGAPQFEIEMKDLNPIEGPDVSDDFKITFKNFPAELNPESKGIMVYKQEGKYTVLFGQVTALKAIVSKKSSVKVTLISGPALKKARIVEEVEVSTSPTDAVASTGYTPNRPRFTDQRTERPNRPSGPSRPYGDKPRSFSNNRPRP